MVYKVHKNGSYNIHTIKTDRFKNIQIEVIFRNNIDPKRVSKRILLFDLLLETNALYKTKRDIILKQEELYNALAFSITYKLGNEVLTSFGLDMLNPKYADDNYTKEALEFFFGLLFNPNVINNEFDEASLNSIRTRLISDIKCLKETPGRYASIKAFEAMDPNSVTSIKMSGTEEDMLAITPSNLYEEYIDILNHDYVDIYVIGDFDEDEILSLISDNVKLSTIKDHKITLDAVNKVRKKVNKVKETSSYAQSHIVCIYNMADLTSYEKKYAAQIYNMILGSGGLETKLYHNLRDEHSLCYSVKSYYYKHDNILVITTSVDKENTELAIKLIKRSVEDMLTKVTDEDVSTAVSTTVSSINMLLDSSGKIIDEYLFRNITDIDDIETRIETYKKVTRKDVMKVAKKAILNTVYILEGGDNDEA